MTRLGPELCEQCHYLTVLHPDRPWYNHACNNDRAIAGTPGQGQASYVSRSRVERIRAMAESGMTPTEIARKTGRAIRFVLEAMEEA